MKKKSVVLLFLSIIIMGCTANNSNEIKVFEEYINSDWKLVSSEKINISGDKISLRDVAVDGWFDINIPSTVLSGLMQNGLYSDIYYSNNIDTVSADQFSSSWWYVKDFAISDWNENEYYSLNFEGINYQANIWVNGNKVAGIDEVEGPFRIFDLDITEYAQANNRVAVEVVPPAPTSLTIGFVDWNPEAPDRNMGLWRGVKLKKSGVVSIENIAISSNLNLDDYSYADLLVDAEIKNHTSKKVSGVLRGEIDGGISLKIPYELAPLETKRIKIDSKQEAQLHVKNPRLWWPYNMGTPELYNAHFSIYASNSLVHQKAERFGIRKIEDYTFEINGLTHRGYKINGRDLLLRGGGWVDDLLLADSDAKVKAQVDYVKDMNMNLIRLEGFWGNSKAMYDACEENGILLMIGLSCQWEWENYCGRPETEYMSVETDYDIDMITKSYQDQVKWGMNNPAIFLWVYGSDKLPVPKFERSLTSAIREYDVERVMLTSCQNVTSEVSGPSGAKMFGPYEYVTPIYWYIDSKFGGAYGFNTETGPGAQIPPIESIKRMLKPEDVALVNKEGWQFHSGRNEFQELDRFLLNYYARYWKDSDVEDFAFNVQMSNYEAVRAMFESFVIKRQSGATGVVQWMLNSAWPEMVWQLYDWYLNPNGAYFGTKAANQAINLLYNYGDKAVYMSNMTLEDHDLTAHVELYDINSNSVYSKKLDLNFKKESVENILSLDDLQISSNVYFMSLRLFDKRNNEVSNNFYWLSQKEDKPEFEKSNWFYTPNKEYASFAQLKEMPKSSVEAKWKITNEGGKKKAIVTLQNMNDNLAFFIEMKIMDEKGNTILPAMWSDNYVSLLPGETRTFSVDFPYGNLVDGAQLGVQGFNCDIVIK